LSIIQHIDLLLLNSNVINVLTYLFYMISKKNEWS